MHDNPQVGAGPAFALPDYAVIELEGRDSASFAQAQFMNDVAVLAIGHWHWSGWLTPKGRLVALFAVLKLADDRLWLLLPDAVSTTLVTALQRFVFRSKLTIRVRDDLHVRGSFAAPHAAVGSRFEGDGDADIELDFGGAGAARSVLVGRTISETGDSDVARWAAFDLEHGLPRLPASQVEHWTPQQLSLERLNAFSIKKGCYPGQEIVARTHFLGKAKRGLALLEADAPLAAGEEVRAGEAPLGSVIASANANGRHLALAVLPLEHEATALRIAGVSVRETPLLPGLAR